MIFSNSKIYDILKWTGSTALPAIAVFIITMGDVWGIQYSKEISATVTAVAVLLNAFLGVSSIKYHESPAEEEQG